MNYWRKQKTFDLDFSASFLRRLNKLCKNNLILKSQINETLSSLEYSPFAKPLKTHKVMSSFGKVYSTKVNDDLRILWKFDQGRAKVLYILDLGGHSGSHKVYK